MGTLLGFFMLRYLQALFLFLCLPLMTAFAAPLVRGDYDNDGYQDLAVSLVNRNGLVGNTPYLVRGTQDGPMFWVFSRPADAFAPGRFFRNSGTAPASILVTTANEPLLWTVITPNRTEVTVRFGLPGDIVTNLIDWDADKLDDFLVVRAGAAIGDVTPLNWYVSFSASGGAVGRTTFGELGDRVFTFFDNGVPHFGAVRIASEQECPKLGDGTAQLVWYGRNFTLNPSETVITKRCWGLVGDIPLVRADYDGNGKAEWIVVRPSGGKQIAYILHDDQETTEAVPLGLETSVPQIGLFKEGRPRFIWSQRDQGLVGMSKRSGSPTIFPFGIATNIIIRADGTVVQPTSSDRFLAAEEPDEVAPTPPPASGSLGCQVQKSFQDGGEGNLWKPVSEGFNGNPVALFPSYYNGANVAVYAADGSLATTVGRTKCCNSNGNRAHFWFNKRASSMRSQAPLTVRVVRNNVVECFPVPDPTQRYD